MGDRKRHDYNNPRFPAFTKRFRKIVDNLGGISETSRLTGVSRPTLTFWYNGERTPDAVKLRTVSEALGISSDWFLDLVDIPNRDTSLQSVNAVTGLSVEAICKLSSFKEADTHFPALISAMIEDDNCAYFLSLYEAIISNEGSKDLISVTINGEELKLFAENHLKAVFQAQIMENIHRVAEIYKAKEG